MLLDVKSPQKKQTSQQYCLIDDKLDYQSQIIPNTPIINPCFGSKEIRDEISLPVVL